MTITPEDSSAFFRTSVDTSHWGEPHVLGVPILNWVGDPKKGSGGIGTFELLEAETTVIVINPTSMFGAATANQPFFLNSGTFEFSGAADAKVILRGGPVFLTAFNRTVCCIGADDRLIVSINNTVVVNFDVRFFFFSALDPGNEGIDITSAVRAGTNTFSAVAFDTRGGFQWITPLRLEIIEFTQRLDHFEVTFENDTIAFTETSKIFVQAKDANDQDIDFSTTALLTLSVTANEEFGTFIDKNGDTLKTVPVRLENIPYGDAKDGLIRFTAVKKNPDSVITCPVQVGLPDDLTKTGEKEIVVLEQTLKIVMNQPHEVQPVIPPATVNAPRGENRKQFTVQLTRGGQPVPNHPFQLTTDYVDGTGGHDHVTPRRTVSRENYGHFVLRRTNAHHDRPYEGQTQANGREEFDYVASVFGDSMRIYVRSNRHPQLLHDSVTVVERVPGLVALEPGQQYELVGAPANHSGTNDPCRPDPPTSENSRNHYGTAALIAAIQNIATTYGSLHPGVRLRINDMSLEFGGLFDIGNRWRTGIREGHFEHRIGENADVAFKGIDAGYRCVNISPDDLSPLIKRYTTGQPKRHDDHYHIRIR